MQGNDLQATGISSGVDVGIALGVATGFDSDTDPDEFESDGILEIEGVSGRLYRPDVTLRLSGGAGASVP